MFNSGVTVAELITSLEAEVDIAGDLAPSFFVNHINAVEQMLYSDIIKEQAVIGIDNPKPLIDLSELKDESEKPYNIRFEDIYTVFACDHKNNEEHEEDERVREVNGYEFNDYQLFKTTLTSGVIFGDTWWNDGGKLGINTDKKHIKIVYYVRPVRKTGKPKENECISLPPEFVDLIKCRLRAEMYKAVNEDELAVKWLNDYNVLVETFSAWVENRRPSFGM